MKKIFAIIIAGVVMVRADAQFTKATLQATGLTCAMCSNAVNKALQAVPFIQNVKSDIKNSAFNIVFKENAHIDIDAIKNAVEDAGFAVGSLSLTGNFRDLKIENDKHVQIGDEHFHFIKVNSRLLSGEQTIRIVDKDFLTAKQFRKFSDAAHAKCLETGKAESCCPGLAPGTRIYHATI